MRTRFQFEIADPEGVLVMGLDPYFDWLDIPPGRRPPTHYEVLGVPHDLTDPTQLREAWILRAREVQKYQLRFPDEATQLQRELSAAHACLSDSAKRTNYDRELGLSANMEKSASINTSEPPARSPEAKTTIVNAASPKTRSPRSKSSAAVAASNTMNAKLASEWTQDLAAAVKLAETAAPLKPVLVAPSSNPKGLIRQIDHALGERLGDERRFLHHTIRGLVVGGWTLATLATLVVIVWKLTPSSTADSGYSAPPGRATGSVPPKLVATIPPTPAAPPKYFVKSVEMHMVLLHAGAYRTGAEIGLDPPAHLGELPAHVVRISSDCYLGVCEVTQRQYVRVMENNPSYFQSVGPTSEQPVEQVTWFDVITFCNRLSELEGHHKYYTMDGSNNVSINGGDGYRLPTEAEWEIACRSGAPLPFGAGRDRPQIDKFAWWAANSGGQTHSVGQLAANPMGFHDLQGNVWEWCWDYFAEDYYTADDTQDPQGPISGTERVVRGGAWDRDSIEQFRCAFRTKSDPTVKFNFLGFRIARNYAQ